MTFTTVIRGGAFLLVAFFITANVHAQVKKLPVKKTITQKSVLKKVYHKPVVKIPGTLIKITTDSGVMVFRLYEKTVQHRDNFIKLANDKFYDSLLFHRVINGFMIQGGDPQSKLALAGVMLGNGGPGYTIPAEFDTALFHKKGVLAAARDNNPEKASSGSQFYIVQGKTYTDEELNTLEMQMGIKFSAAKRNAYKTVGGTPFLDMNYTVFGEMVSGMDVLDKIARVPKGPDDRPLGDVRMYIKVIKQEK